MLIRTAFVLLLLLPSAASAQELGTALSAVVRISGTLDGTPVRGTGFVVGLAGNKATILTAAHVVQGVQKLEVTFAAELTERFSAEPVLGMESDTPNGLAVFQVRGAPPTVTALKLESETSPRLGDELFLLVFPQMAPKPEVLTRRVKRVAGTLLLLDQGIEEGSSGGPVLRSGKVVGVVTTTDDQTTYAVKAAVAREALAGWIDLSEPAPACVPGEEHTEAGIVFVRICPGTFTMGSDENDPQGLGTAKPAHQVTLSEFWIAKTEISNAQYRRFRLDHKGEDNLPATSVTWDEAKAACEHFGGRLPTEAEWEFAARAGSQAAWSFGNDEKMLGEYAWYRENSGNVPHPVGTKKANAWGLHDMLGNVWEWVADWYDTYSPEAQKDPTGPKTGQDRLVRGGSWALTPEYLHSTVRVGYTPSIRYKDFGFRCARSPRRQP